MNPRRARENPETAAAAIPLSRRLREHTRAIHRRAEQSGVIGRMISGRIDVRSYGLLLRNLLPVYSEMEQRLRRVPHNAALQLLATPGLARAPALSHDLDALCGPDWRSSLPLLTGGERYRDRIACCDPGRLIAHAYVRYFGDLSGGQLLRDRLRDSAGLPESALSFYTFPGIDDRVKFKAEIRSAMDRLSGDLDDSVVLTEAVEAFELNIELSEEIARHRGAT
ncbi:MAG: biliverdin-producing heme oxygenase [Chromatiales bacterium]|jgi:heme oxygenase